MTRGLLVLAFMALIGVLAALAFFVIRKVVTSDKDQPFNVIGEPIGPAVPRTVNPNDVWENVPLGKFGQIEHVPSRSHLVSEIPPELTELDNESFPFVDLDETPGYAPTLSDTNLAEPETDFLPEQILSDDTDTPQEIHFTSVTNHTTIAAEQPFVDETETENEASAFGSPTTIDTEPEPEPDSVDNIFDNVTLPNIDNVHTLFEDVSDDEPYNIIEPDNTTTPSDDEQAWETFEWNDEDTIEGWDNTEPDPTPNVEEETKTLQEITQTFNTVNPDWVLQIVPDLPPMPPISNGPHTTLKA